MNIAIIPARGGSKRIPRKNIKLFAGKPIIAYAISAAKESGLFEHIVVSTDDDEIASVSKEWGAIVPFMRPTGLADDHTPTVPVVADAIEKCEDLGWYSSFVCCIYPCVPFLRAEDLRSALAMLKNSTADYCFPIAEFPAAVQRALRQNANGFVEPIYPEHQLTRTQDLEPAHFDAGQFYWGSREAWRRNPRPHTNALALSIPSQRVVDIDTNEDWDRAEFLYAFAAGNASR
jgi:pseudaminic acid cytidylyltransferase